MKHNDMALQDLLGITSDIKYQEFNIVILLDKDKKDKKYSSSIKCYNEVLNITAPSNLTSDFLCLIIPNVKKDNSKFIFNKFSEQDIYLKRFSGVINQLKIYFEREAVYTKKYNCTVTHNKIEVPDNKNVCCRFVNDNVSVNIFCHNETTIKPIDKYVCTILSQLIDIAQMKSEQLTIIKMNESGKAMWSNRRLSTVSETLAELEVDFNKGIYYAASYDMVSSKEYYFDFTGKDTKLPPDFEKHCIITGPVKDTVTFSKLNHIRSKIQRDGETIRMNKITEEDIKAHS